MENLISLISVAITITFMIVIIYVLAFIMPKPSHDLKISLIMFIACGLIFMLKAYNSLDTESYNISSLIGFLVCVGLVVSGGKDVAFKTVVTVFSTITNKPIGQMNAGAYKWSCPFTTKTSIDDSHNSAADLQSFVITIPVIGYHRTATDGRRVVFKDVTFTLKLIESRLSEIYNIEGGIQKIQDRIRKFVAEFFEKEAKKKSSDFWDAKIKGENPVEWITKNLLEAIEEFSHRNHYPYEIDSKGETSEITIGTIELNPEYYDALSKADSADIAAKRNYSRILETGQSLLPNASEKEQAEEAKIALGITKKDIQEKKFGIDPETGAILKDVLTAILKK